MTQRDAGAIRPIKPRVKKGLLNKMFGGKPFIHTVNELIKNSRDYGATLIAISFDDRDTFAVLDNGDGMGGENRDGFASVNDTTSTTERQAGRYGTGVKQMLYSHASAVEVVTVSAEEPNFVYRFRFKTESYEELARSEQPFMPERLLKTAETWPYPSKTGSRIIYTLRDPNSKVILRGERLATELASRLPLKFRDIVTVDGQPIPAKKIVGKVYTHSEKHPRLGSLHAELYRPERRRSDEDLRLAGVEVGEIPLKNVSRVLGDLQDMIPPVFKLDGVCGTITVPAFKTYANEDRNTIDPKIADDPGIMPFIRFLQKIAPDVQKALELRLEVADTEEAMNASVTEVRGLLAKAYGTSEEEDGPDNGTDGGGADGDEEDGPGVDKPPVRLILERHEFEPGERIVARARLSPAAASEYDMEQLHWHTLRSGATLDRQNGGELVLIAKDVGDHDISVEIPGTPYSDQASYKVVAERMFRLSLDNAKVEVGGQLLLTGINADKLGGKIVWTCGNKAGELKPQGAKATFYATRPGHEDVTAHSATDASVSAACHIRVLNRPEEHVRIREHTFNLKHFVGNQQTKPVSIAEMSKVHDLHISTAARGMQVAREKGGLTLFLAMAIAMEYASFVKLKLEREDTEDSDISIVQEEITMTAYQVFQEILQKK